MDKDLQPDVFLYAFRRGGDFRCQYWDGKKWKDLEVTAEDDVHYWDGKKWELEYPVYFPRAGRLIEVEEN